VAPVPDPLDELYGLPLSEFTSARNTAARELKRAGDAAGAEVIGAAQKPSGAAWALNQLARRERRRVERFLGLAAELREAQLAGGDDLTGKTRALRAAADELVEDAAGLTGRDAGATVRGGVRQSLDAAAVDDEAAERLLEGRLVRELEPAGFGSLAAHVPKLRPKEASRTAEPRPDTRAARKAAQTRVEQARKELGAAERSEREARRALDQATTRVTEAKDALARANTELEATT
jgi:hypothetical protein